MTYKLPKNERLHSQKLIKELFDKGSSFFLYPFKVYVLEVEQEVSGTHQVLFSVSKKKIKKAVHRNLVKRRMREAYRLNKSLLENLQGNKKMIALVYVSSDIATFQTIQLKTRKILATIAAQNQPTTQDS